MTLWATVPIALGALRAHRFRAALTVLGVIIGVAAVIAMVSVGAGAEARIAAHMQAMGSNLILVLTGTRPVGGARGVGMELTLTEEDARAIADEIPNVEVAAPVMRGTAHAVYANANWPTIVTGVTPDYLLSREWRLAAGQMFGPDAVAAAGKVAVLGATVVDNLFGGTDPVGQTIRLRGVPLMVVGILEPKGQSAWAQDQDDVILIPISTAKTKVLGGNRRRGVNTILVRARDGAPLAEVREEIRALLRQRHRLELDQEDDFRPRLLEEIFAAEQESARTMTVLLGAIASASLLVGGIGVMNIMLVSVTERTREIGLRMAVGARRRHILAQFLIEAMTLSVVGGVAGIGAGLLASWAIATVGEWSTEVTPGAIGLALLASAGVGVFFGLYPAHRASRLDPIEALGRD